MKNIILNYLILLIFQVNFAQIKLDDALNIKTIIFKSTASNSYAPIVKLGEPLLLSFDDLNANEQNYSYKIMKQSAGRTDRLNTPFKELYYYHLKSRSAIDLAISRALSEKRNFNETKYVGSYKPKAA